MNKDFLKACLIRAAWTAAESAVAMIPIGVGLEEVGWLHVLSVSATSAIISFLKSFIAGVPEAAK